MTRHFAFLFSLEAAFSLTLVIIASAYLLAFSPQKENVGEFLACSDAAGALAELRAFSSQDALRASVGEAGEMLGMCVEAKGAGANASSCEGQSEAGEKYSFSFPIWKDGRVESAQAECRQRG